MAKVNAKYFCCRKMLRKALNSSLAHIVHYLVCYLHNLSITNDYSCNLSSIVRIISVYVVHIICLCVSVVCIICLSVYMLLE